MSPSLCVVGGKRRCVSQMHRSSFSPETLLSHLFVFVLITALRAATKNTAGIYEVNEGQCRWKRRGALLCAHAWLCEFTGTS